MNCVEQLGLWLGFFHYHSSRESINPKKKIKKSFEPKLNQHTQSNFRPQKIKGQHRIRIVITIIIPVIISYYFFFSTEDGSVPMKFSGPTLLPFL